MGLINSISQYFSILFWRVTYRTWVFIIVAFSFLICNLGLTMILSISLPVLNAIYPISIVLILLGLSHKLWKGNPYIYPVTVSATGCISVLYALDTAGVPLFFLGDLLRRLPLYGMGFSWVIFSLGGLAVSLLLPGFHRAKVGSLPDI